jgi:hypothetical protein
MAGGRNDTMDIRELLRHIEANLTPPVRESTSELAAEPALVQVRRHRLRHTLFAAIMLRADRARFRQ